MSQGNRDSLNAGRAAYDRADFPAAVRLLMTGLDPAAGPRDTAWINGVHKLVHAMLQTGDTAKLGLWLGWANRVAPNFPVDTLLFPPDVQRVILAARAALRPEPGDSQVVTTWEFGGSAANQRGALKLGRASGFSLGVIDSVGTVLPDERRTLAAGRYTVTLTVDGQPPIRVTREVLHGVTTIITPRPRAAAAGAPSPRPAADSSAALEARLSAGGSASCFSGTQATFCWGSNAAGLLGGGWTDTARAPVVVSGAQRFATISIGGAHACALTAAGAAFCWGAGTAGQLGTGATTSSASPVAVSGAQTFTAISAGALHTCAIARSGAVFCWGTGAAGQLGNRSSAPSSVPVGASTPAGTSFASLSAGGNHTCALTTRGAAYCWGAGAAGELGNGSSSNASAPVPVLFDGTFRALASGASHSCGLTTGGTVLCWGSNGAGQLGNNGTAPSSRPTPISDSTQFSAIAAGDLFSCGLTSSGAAWCWGAGTAGQLGNGRTADSPRPSLVIGGLAMRTLALGAAHACAATAEGMVWCWGSNAAGQVGALAGRSTATPLPVLARPEPRLAAIGLQPRRELRDDFDDGNLTAGVVWQRDSVAGARLWVDSGQLVVARSGSRGAVGAAGVGLPVRLSARNASLRFDVRIASSGTPDGCGLNCAEWPATIRVRVKNRDFTESDVWYVFGPAGTGWRAPGITVVAQNLPVGPWLRRQRIMIQDAAPRADSIIEIAFGGIGTDFESRFDNVMMPAPVVVSVAVTPDSGRITAANGTVQFTATPRDSAGTAQAWATVTWSSSDTAVAKVSASGLVSAVGTGTAQIRATAEGVTGSAKVGVRVPTRPASTRRRARP